MKSVVVLLTVKIRLVPLAAPMVGLTSTGEVKLPVVTVGLVIILLVKVSKPFSVTSTPPFGGNIAVPDATGEALITVCPLVFPATIKFPVLPTSPKVFAAVTR